MESSACRSSIYRGLSSAILCPQHPRCRNRCTRPEAAPALSQVLCTNQGAVRLLYAMRRAGWSAGAPVCCGPGLAGHILGATNLKIQEQGLAEPPAQAAAITQQLRPDNTRRYKGCSYGANGRGRARLFNTQLL